MVVASLPGDGKEETPTVRCSWLRNKWMALVAGLWIMSAAGLSFNFSIYSTALKESLDYTQEQIDLIATASNIGNNVGLPAGLLSSILPEWAVLLLGMAMHSIGYGMLWLVASKRIHRLSFSKIFFYQWLAPTGATLLDTAVLIVCVGNLPRSRGSVVGLLMGLIGLSGAIYAQFYAATLAPDGAGFLLMAAVGPAVTTLVATPLLRPIVAEKDKSADEIAEETSYINFCFGVCFALAIYLTGYSIATAINPLDQWISQVVAVGVIFILLFPLVIPIRLSVWRKMRHMDYGDSNLEQQQKHPEGKKGNGQTDYPWPHHMKKPPQNGFHYGPHTAKTKFVITVTGGNKRLNGVQLARSGAECLEATVKKANGVNGTGQVVDVDVVARLESAEKGHRTNGPHGSTDSCQVKSSGERATDRAAGPYAGGVPALPPKDGLTGPVFDSPAGPDPDSGPNPLATGRLARDCTCMEALASVNFWLLFLSMLFGVGSTATVINNLDAIAKALGYLGSGNMVSLISISNFAGRVVGGFYSDYLLQTKGQPRSVFMAWSQAVLIGGYLLMAFPFQGSLYFALTIVGIALGATDALVAAATSELFGLRSFGLIYNIVTSAPALGSYLFATLLAGYVYDKEAYLAPGIDGVELCYGTHCFRLTFILMAIVSALGVVANVMLTHRTRAFYQSLYVGGQNGVSQEPKLSLSHTAQDASV